MTKFYMFDQNNSGGHFNHNEDAGIGYQVVIEALDHHHANERAENIGIYFNGCDDDIDCECCGDRWYPVNERDGTDEPSSYGGPVEAGWGIPSYIHYLNGDVVKISEDGEDV
jgi:hypothetical protein